MRLDPTGGPDEVVCAPRGVCIAPDANGHAKIALGTLVATQKRSGRNRLEGSAWLDLLCNEVVT